MDDLADQVRQPDRSFTHGSLANAAWGGVGRPTVWGGGCRGGASGGPRCRRPARSPAQPAAPRRATISAGTARCAGSDARLSRPHLLAPRSSATGRCAFPPARPTSCTAC
jgi:hypothetical protein